MKRRRSSIIGLFEPTMRPPCMERVATSIQAPKFTGDICLRIHLVCATRKYNLIGKYYETGNFGPECMSATFPSSRSSTVIFHFWRPSIFQCFISQALTCPRSWPAKQNVGGRIKQNNHNLYENSDTAVQKGEIFLQVSSKKTEYSDWNTIYF